MTTLDPQPVQPPAVSDLTPETRPVVQDLVYTAFTNLLDGATVPEGMALDDLRLRLYDVALQGVGSGLTPPVGLDEMRAFVGELPRNLRRPGIPTLLRQYLSKRPVTVLADPAQLAHFSGYSTSAFYSAFVALEAEGYTFARQDDLPGALSVTRPPTAEERALDAKLVELGRLQEEIAALQEAVAKQRGGR